VAENPRYALEALADIPRSLVSYQCSRLLSAFTKAIPSTGTVSLEETFDYEMDDGKVGHNEGDHREDGRRS
jgi:hypothetical protein